MMEHRIPISVSHRTGNDGRVRNLREYQPLFVVCCDRARDAACMMSMMRM